MTNYTLSSERDKTRITFDCHFRTPGSEVGVKRIVEVLPNAGAVELLYAYIISNTRDILIEYDPDEPRSEIVLMLEQFWVWCKLNLFRLETIPGSNIAMIRGIVDDPAVITESFDRFNEMVFDKLQEHWAMGYKNAQVIFPANEIIRPDELLTKELLTSPDFLARVHPI